MIAKKENPLGECCCIKPLIERNGKVMYPHDFGKYYYNIPRCKHWEPKIPKERLQIRLELICGNCRWWEELEGCSEVGG